MLHSCFDLALDARGHYALVLKGGALVRGCGRGVHGHRALVLDPALLLVRGHDGRGHYALVLVDVALVL